MARPKGELVFGLGDGRKGPEWGDLAELYNLLFAGAVGTGKSSIINQMIVYIAEHYSPQEVQFVMLDLKGGDGVEFGMYESLPHLAAPIVTSPEQCEKIFKALDEELEQRYALLNLAGVKKIEDYYQNGQRMPRKVVWIDEAAEIPKQVMNLLESLIRRSRAAGLHFVFATQRPEVAVLSNQIRNNIRGTGVFWVGDPYTSEISLGSGDRRAAALPPNDPGLMIWKNKGWSGRVRTIWLSPQEAERRVADRTTQLVGSLPVPGTPYSKGVVGGASKSQTASAGRSPQKALPPAQQNPSAESPQGSNGGERFLPKSAASGFRRPTLLQRLTGWHSPVSQRISSEWHEPEHVKAS